jgi:hypothetical protein
MAKEGYITETREVSGFDRVILREFGTLNIVQGEEESLIIETHPDLMPKILSEVRDGKLILGIKGGILDKFTDFLSTSISGYRITFNLTVKELRGLTVSGAASVNQGETETDHIAYRLSGAGSVNVEQLSADSVQVNLSGSGKIELQGKAEEQRVVISGAGGYVAKKLETTRTVVKLSGAGKGIVWATDELEVKISGIGSVDYYGEPEMNVNISGLGNVVKLGEP